MLIGYIIFWLLFGIGAVYLPEDHWKYFNKKSKIRRFIHGIGYSAIGVLGLYLLNWWIVLIGGILFATVAIFSTKHIKKIWKYSLYLGLFLMIFDWILENIGALMGFWVSYGSMLFVSAVPLEVMIACVSVGVAYSVLVPKKWNLKYIIFCSLIPAVGGTLGEARLQSIGLMTYGNGWTWIHAFISYFAAWILLSVIWYKILLKRVK